MPKILKGNFYRDIAAFRSAARGYSNMALNTLVGIASDEDSHPSARVQAAIHLLDRGWGKCEQTLAGVDGGEITVVIRQIVEVPMKTIEHSAIENKSD